MKTLPIAGKKWEWVDKITCVGKYRMTFAWFPLQNASTPSSLKTLVAQFPIPE